MDNRNGSMVATSESLQKMKEHLSELEKKLRTNHQALETFLKTLRQMGWDDEIFAMFNKVTSDLNAELVPLWNAMKIFSEIKGKEKEVVDRYKKIIVPKFN